MNTLMQKGYKRSLQITRHHAKSFYFCSLMLSKQKRMAAYSVYAFLRMLDDTFDSSSPNSEKEIEKWHKKISRLYDNSSIKDPVLLCLKETINKYNIQADHFYELLNGMKMDISKTEYTDFPELYKYCYRVAGVVGLIMIEIFGYSNKEALLYAEKMGIAMQLTNILRDIKEDLEMDRIYLPLEELDKYGLNKNDLKKGRVNDPFKKFMKFQIKRARSYYEASYRGLEFITDKNSRFIARLMGIIYSGILDSIEKNDYDVFSVRNHVPFNRKILLSLKTLGRINES